ncbi:MAG: hypothetical protein M1821_008911 [Bathelium mastoideum]|nr:MAG: hypothetical protein M1821_008911 [Bathelium mastoideum]
MPDGKPKKLQRASRACDFCHKRSIKCSPSSEDPEKCRNCFDFGVDCAFTRPWKRARGGQASTGGKGSEIETVLQKEEPDNDACTPKTYEPPRLPASTDIAVQAPAKRSYEFGPEMRTTHPPRNRLGEAWKAFAAAVEPTISALVDVYYSIVYPIFPLFHRGRLLERIKHREYLTDRGFFSSLMAMCALAAGRTRDGAASWYTERSDVSRIQTETFYLAALDGIPKELSSARGLDYLRACAVMAIASIQLGKIDSLHEYLGQYHALLALQRFHDEASWSKDISVIEREERRRLIWSTYTLDVYSSIVWNTPLCSKAGHLAVEYPSEVEDDLIAAGQESVSNPNCWLHGWNFTTDLYRVMQQSVDEVRARRNSINARLRHIPSSTKVKPFSGDAVLVEVFTVYDALTPPFKTPPLVTGDHVRDIFGFQFANIQATLALLRMVLFNAEEKINVDTKCEVANSLITSLSNVPRPYLKAISTPLIYHLAGIGNILSSALEGPLSEDSYQKLKTEILSMAGLLESLEENLHRIVGVGRGMRQHLEKVDEYMYGPQRVPYLRPFQNTVADLTTSVVLPNVPVSPSSAAVQESPHQHFQIPPYLLEDWSWPIDICQDYGVFPLPTEQGYAHPGTGRG